jgi:hypothetical protein
MRPWHLAMMATDGFGSRYLSLSLTHTYSIYRGLFAFSRGFLQRGALVDHGGFARTFGYLNDRPNMALGLEDLAWQASNMDASGDAQPGYSDGWADGASLSTWP